MNKAESKEEFIEVWKHRNNDLILLLNSLPDGYYEKVKDLINEMDTLVEVAADHAFPEEGEE